MVLESLCLFYNVEQGLWFQNLSVYSIMWSRVYGSKISLSILQCEAGFMVLESICLFSNVEQGLWFQNLSVYSIMWSRVYGSRISLSIL